MQAKFLAAAALFILPVAPASAAALSLHDVLSLRQACGNDIASLCPGLSRGNGRILQCVMTHATSLSPACATELKAEKAKFPATTLGTTLYDTD